MKDPRTLAASAALAVAAGVCAWMGSAHADCVRIPLVSTGFDDAVACHAAGDDADGTVAVSAQGDARASGTLPMAAVSGNGKADRSIVCASGTGTAGGPHSDLENECTVSISALGGDAGEDAASSAYLVALAGRGSARAPVAISVFGDSHGQLVSVSGTGRAGGDTYTGEHPSPYVAVSGCSAEHAPHEEGQVLVADPSHVHLNVDVQDITGQDGSFEPTDVGTGAVGTTVTGVTCDVKPGV
ncbi:MAG TPA: hypothetical protein VM840_11995 [Actinomycetota bacterium]|nr:hypothetical protein [Actinomycetota bacterium]